jgi:hypothetical protein
MIQLEEMHAAEVDKMLRKPGDVATYAKSALTTFGGPLGAARVPEPRDRP